MIKWLKTALGSVSVTYVAQVLGKARAIPHTLLNIS